MAEKKGEEQTAGAKQRRRKKSERRDVGGLEQRQKVGETDSNKWKNLRNLSGNRVSAETLRPLPAAEPLHLVPREPYPLASLYFASVGGLAHPPPPTTRWRRTLLHRTPPDYTFHSTLACSVLPKGSRWSAVSATWGGVARMLRSASDWPGGGVLGGAPAGPLPRRRGLKIHSWKGWSRGSAAGWGRGRGPTREARSSGLGAPWAAIK